MKIPKFRETHLEQLVRILANAVTHHELSGILAQCSIPEQGGGPKWQRTLFALRAKQDQDGCGSNVGGFVEAVMDPARFTGEPEKFSAIRESINTIFAFSGIHLGEDGKLRPVSAAKTLTEAQERAGRLKAALEQRKVHPHVLHFCKEELLHENYFHAVFEATKSVADRIREMTGLTSDGAKLVDDALGGDTPLLALNSLRTETERSEHKGFAHLLKGVFGVLRNVTAHVPKVKWSIAEQDALDLLTLVSYLHRRLEGAVRTPY